MDYTCPSEDPFPLVKRQLRCLDGGATEEEEVLDQCPKILACRKPDIDHGSLFCPSEPAASMVRTGIECYLICQSGFLPLEAATSYCMHDELLDEYIWDSESSTMQCIPQIGIVIGGILNNFAYSSAAEIVDPLQQSCRSRTLPDYPLKVAGSFAGRVNSRLLICGGVVMTHGECDRDTTRKLTSNSL